MNENKQVVKIEKPDKEMRGGILPASSGGAYIPPFKLKKILEEQALQGDKAANQKIEWEALRKSINGIVNKANVTNIHTVTLELFNHNLIKGRGLLAKSIIKA